MALRLRSAFQSSRGTSGGGTLGVFADRPLEFALKAGFEPASPRWTDEVSATYTTGHSRECCDAYHRCIISDSAGEQTATEHRGLFPLSHRKSLPGQDSHPRPPACRAKYPELTPPARNR